MAQWYTHWDRAKERGEFPKRGNARFAKGYCGTITLPSATGFSILALL